MRALGFAVVTVVSVLTLAPREATAAAYNLPWCAQYYDRSGVRACSFYTWQQCQASISGIGGNCVLNSDPRAYPPPEVEPRRAKRRRVDPN